MTQQDDATYVSDPDRFPDGSPKSSPDDTSLLGLRAVWSELDAPMPPKGVSHAARQRVRRRDRRRRHRQRMPLAVVVGLGVAVSLTLGMFAFLVAQFI